MSAALEFLHLALTIGFALLAASLVLCLIRLVKGPHIGDRILALDAMVVNVIGMIVLLGIAQGTGLYFESALLIAMLGFVSTVAYARFILRGDIIE